MSEIDNDSVLESDVESEVNNSNSDTEDSDNSNSSNSGNSDNSESDLDDEAVDNVVDDAVDDDAVDNVVDYDTVDNVVDDAVDNVANNVANKVVAKYTDINIKKKKKQYKSSDSENNSISDTDFIPEKRKKNTKSSKDKKTNKVEKTVKKTSIKKGPGRPRKNPKKEPIVRKGIAKNPSNPEDHVEFLYDQPVILKKIFQFFKLLAAPQIQILFRPKDIIFYAKDHHNVSKIYIKIDATKINHYYCKSLLDIGISARDMELILNKVDKEYTSIMLFSVSGSTQRSITLILENYMQINEIHHIDLIGQYNKLEDESLFDELGYTIQFELPSKYFRKTINDIKTLSPQLSITQDDSDSALVFEYTTINKKIQSRHVVNKKDKIKLVSKLAEGESFRVEIKIEYINPISKAQISDEINILVDENKPFMTRTFIDSKTIEIKTITEIVDNRPLMRL